MKRVVIALSLLATAGLPYSLHAAENKPAPKTMKVPEAPANKNEGFKTIFDGKSLNGWDYDPASWRLENGVMIGERKTALTKLEPAMLEKFAPFIVWKGTARDFELKLEYRISPEGDSGIFYRVQPHPTIKGRLANLYGPPGYQDPIEGSERNKPGPNDPVMDKSTPGWTKARRWGGANYHGTRQFLALPGQLTRAVDDGVRIVGSLDNASRIGEILGKDEEWAEAHIIARGNVLMHLRNGKVISVVIDDDAKNRAMEGTIALDLHPGPAMKVEFRNIRLKTLTP